MDGSEFEPTAEEVAAEEAEEPLMMSNADKWDQFLAWVRSQQEPWTSDSDEYREGRSLEYFNYAMGCSRDLIELKPTLKSWVPHVACFIASRQIAWLGEDSSRSADACESYGAYVKKLIKHQTCRRRIASADGQPVHAKHTRGQKSWAQAFARGYIEQAFRRCCVHEALLHGEANKPYLQRADWKLKEKGLKQEQKSSERPVPPSVRSLMCTECDNDA